MTASMFMYDGSSGNTVTVCLLFGIGDRHRLDDLELSFVGMHAIRFNVPDSYSVSAIQDIYHYRMDTRTDHPFLHMCKNA